MQKAAKTMCLGELDQNSRCGHSRAICANEKDSGANIRRRLAMIPGHLRGAAAFVALRVTPIALLVILALPARAQFIGFTSPQTFSQILTSSIACTGGTQLFAISNLGQNQHFASASLTSVQEFTMAIQGVDAAGVPFDMSDDLILSGTATGSLYGSGWYPTLRVRVNCTGGTFTVNYSGTSRNAPKLFGNYEISQQNKRLWGGIPANASDSTFFSPAPFGNADGLMVAQYAGGSVAGSTLTVTCDPIFSTTTLPTAIYSLPNDTAQHVFKVPPVTCPEAVINYTSGGATVATLSVDYVLSAPGTSYKPISTYEHIMDALPHSIKTVPGAVTSLAIGSPVAGTVTLHDLNSTACAALPLGPNPVSILTALAGDTPRGYQLDLFFRTGICVQASMAMDLTVGFQ